MYRHKPDMSSNLSSDNSMPSDTQKKTSVGFTSIMWYQSRIHRTCEITSPRDRTVSCTNACLNMLVLLASIDRTHKQYGPAIIISGTVIWKAQSATGRRRAFQHTNTGIVWSVLCPLILPVKPTMMTAAAGESFFGWPGQHHNAVSMRATRVASGQQRCADRRSLIHISPQSLPKIDVRRP